MENLTGGTPPVRYLPCVVPCKLYFEKDEVKTFVSKICGNEYKHKEEYFYVRQYMPEVPMGTLCMLIPSKKYYINMRLSTLWILCVLLDINITKGWAVALGSMGGEN